MGKKSEVRNLIVESFNVDSQFNMNQDGNVTDPLETNQGTGAPAGFEKDLLTMSSFQEIRSFLVIKM